MRTGLVQSRTDHNQKKTMSCSSLPDRLYRMCCEDRGDNGLHTVASNVTFGGCLMACYDSFFSLCKHYSTYLAHTASGECRSSASALILTSQSPRLIFYFELFTLRFGHSYGQ